MVMILKIYEGVEILIDEEDAARVASILKPGCQWYFDKYNKVVKGWCMVDGKSTKLALHRVVMNCYDTAFDVDHKQHNKLDYRKDSLRICSHQENCFNNQAPTTLGVYKGVHWRNDRKVWTARIRVRTGRIALGVFASQINAAIAYNVAACKYHGEFAALNKLPFTW